MISGQEGARRDMAAAMAMRDFSSGVRRSETTLLELAGSIRRVARKPVARNRSSDRNDSLIGRLGARAWMVASSIRNDGKRRALRRRHTLSARISLTRPLWNEAGLRGDVGLKP